MEAAEAAASGRATVNTALKGGSIESRSCSSSSCRVSCCGKGSSISRNVRSDSRSSQEEYYK